LAKRKPPNDAALLTEAQEVEAAAAKTVAAIETRIAKENEALAEATASVGTLAEARQALDADVLELGEAEYADRVSELEERTRVATTETSRRRATLTALAGRLEEARFEHKLAAIPVAEARWRLAGQEQRTVSELAGPSLLATCELMQRLREARRARDAAWKELADAFGAVGISYPDERMPLDPPEHDEPEFMPDKALLDALHAVIKTGPEQPAAKHKRDQERYAADRKASHRGWISGLAHKWVKTPDQYRDDLIPELKTLSAEDRAEVDAAVKAIYEAAERRKAELPEKMRQAGYIAFPEDGVGHVAVPADPPAAA
jgi:transcriptional regulator with XRE-family HTH domain